MLLLAWLVIYPILIVGSEAAHPMALREFLTRPGEWAALWASVWISLLSVILAAAIGIPLAFLFEWFDFPGRKTLGALIALPVVLPPLVGVIAFLFLYGESGFVARAIEALLHLQNAPWRLQEPTAILLVSQLSGLKLALMLPVNRFTSCQSCIARSASGGLLWKPRTHLHSGGSVGAQFDARFAGLEYIEPHIAPPQPASQLSVVWLWM